MPNRGLSPETTVASRVPEVVLDTNVALALWLFCDPTLAALRLALEAGRLRWVVSPALLNELSHEIRPSRCERYGCTVEAVRARMRCVVQTRVPDASASHSLTRGLRCTDPKDQMFIDLAAARRVPWLLSRDRAVLKLRRKALALGLRICTPEAWVAVGNLPP
jgi:predicted nucleic acid-binding protein